MNDLLKYKDYFATIHFSTQDDVFYGKVLGINDLITFEGQSVKELKKAFKEAVDDYLSTCEKLKKSPDKTYKGSFNIRVSSDLHKTAAIVALQNNITLNDFVKCSMAYAIKHIDAIRPDFLTPADQEYCF